MPPCLPPSIACAKSWAQNHAEIPVVRSMRPPQECLPHSCGSAALSARKRACLASLNSTSRNHHKRHESHNENLLSRKYTQNKESKELPREFLGLSSDAHHPSSGDSPASASCRASKPVQSCAGEKLAKPQQKEGAMHDSLACITWGTSESLSKSGTKRVACTKSNRRRHHLFLARLSRFI